MEDKINHEIIIRESLNESSIRFDKDITEKDKNDKSRTNLKSSGAPKSPSDLINGLDSFPFFENCIPGAVFYPKKGIN